MTQFVAVKFNPWDRRTYTYRNEGEAIAPGDVVEVVTSEGPKQVAVESVTDKAPAFECKPIARIVPKEEAFK